MAEESDLEKTEAATPRRLEKAREEGQVARSRELNTFVLLALGAGALWVLGGPLASTLIRIMQQSMWFSPGFLAEPEQMVTLAVASAFQALVGLAGLFGLLLVAAVLSSVALGGLVLAGKALAPKFERLNPLKGFKRMFSAHTLVELFKTLSKAAVIGGIGAWAITVSVDEWLSLTRAPVHEALVSGMNRVALTCVGIVSALLLIVLIDVPWQLWSHHKKLRMSRQDVKQEHKESEGDPLLKGKIRQMQRAVARRRMMAAVPTADVVVTNPQHYAVALSYQAERWQAPRVVAKGSGLVAARIRELARENKVPLVRVPPLARALHEHVEIDHEVPAALYEAVAQLLVWAYQLRDGASASVGATRPEDIQVPPQWDPAESSRS